MYLRSVFLAAAAFPLATFAQVSATNVTLDSPFQVRYVSRLNVGDSVININKHRCPGRGFGLRHKRCYQRRHLRKCVCIFSR
jgi:hypothetical protein